MAKFNFQNFNRRFHLYLGMFCLPWFIMYGITSLAFNHGDWFGKGGIQWSEQGSWEAVVELAPTRRIPQDQLQQLIDISSLDIDVFGGYRADEKRVIVYIPSFLDSNRLVYFHEENRLILEQGEFSLKHFLTGMHARGGYQRDSFMHDAWALMVDIVCSAFVLWIVTGIIIWWKSKRMRMAGAIVLLGGFLSFAGFMLWL